MRLVPHQLSQPIFRPKEGWYSFIFSLNVANVDYSTRMDMNDEDQRIDKTTTKYTNRQTDRQTDIVLC